MSILARHLRHILPNSYHFGHEAIVTPTSGPATVPRVLPSLTGLRFLAAFGVVLFHLSRMMAPPSHRGLVQASFYGGATGVSFFFVLSGFVLTWADLDGRTRRGFYRRRFARVYPNHALTLVVALVVLAWLGTPVSTANALLSVALVQSWFRDPTRIFAANAVAWTLSCEAFFYATFPVAIKVLGRLPSARRLWLMGGLALVPVTLPGLVVLIGSSPRTNTFLIAFLPLSRLPEFLLGMALALQVREGAWPRISPIWPALAALIAIRITGISQDFSYTVCFVVVPYLFLIGAVATIDLEGRPSWLRHRAVVRLGQWSYALYLVHYLLIIVAVHFIPPRSSVQCAAAWCALAAASVAAAGIIYQWWERPIERRLRPAATPRAEAAVA